MTPAQLKTLRKRLAMTQIELAEMLGYTRRQIVRLEKGDTPINPRLETVLKMLEAGAK